MADVMLGTFPPGTPLTFEQRGQYLLNDIYKVLCDVRLHLQNIEHELHKSNEPQTPTIDTEPVLGLARKPGSAIVKPKGRR